MKIYTRRGDRGETKLFGGERVPKDHLRVEAYGCVDELNSLLGSCVAASSHADVQQLTQRIQTTLLDLGALLATPDAEVRKKNGIPEPADEDVEALERAIDEFEGQLEPLRRFILPGGAPAAAAFHVARTACRRAERRVVALARAEAPGEIPVRYLNRLSDLLFVVARVENRRAGVRETEWSGGA